MAKSFHTILATGSIEVKHLGEDANFDLPLWLVEAAEILDDEAAMIKWAQDTEIIGGLLHSGIQQEIIRIRAASRPVINSYNSLEKFKEAKEKLIDLTEYHVNERDMQISKKIGADHKAGQSRIDDYVCKMVKKPGQGKAAAVVTPQQAVAVLLAKGLSTEEIIAEIKAQATSTEGTEGA